MVPLIMAAGLLSAPALNPSAADDRYPAKYLRENKSAAAAIQVIISPDGRIAQCKVLSIAGDEEFARATCLLLSPWMWSAARDASGNHAFGLVRTKYVWSIPGTRHGDELRALKLPPDIEMTVNRLPASAKAPVEARLTIEIDAKGAVMACKPSKWNEAPTALAVAACQEVRKLPMDPIALAGTALEKVVMDLRVGFAEASQGTTPR